MGLPNSPMQGAQLRAGGGNFVTAQPLGVVDGVDYQLTGRCGASTTPAIEALLDDGSVVLLSDARLFAHRRGLQPDLADVAISAARVLGADKLIAGASAGVSRRGHGCCASASPAKWPWTVDDARQRSCWRSASRACRPACRAATSSAIGRDALLTELFTTDGSGTLVSRAPFEQSRWASIDDVGGMLELIAPLEESGVLLKRSRELLEAEIGQLSHTRARWTRHRLRGAVSRFPRQAQRRAGLHRLAPGVPR
jgi:amino-acid N-acetyltransferase